MSTQSLSSPTDIAVIALNGRFPAASNVDELWKRLLSGAECISRLTEQELEESGLPARLYRQPGYVPARGTLSGVELFDAAFFDISPREAAEIDPQQRIFLECCWEALERSGYGSPEWRNPVGVFAACSPNSYFLSQARSNDSLQQAISGAADFLATRISYKLDLQGPSITVQTACSSSLVAVHLACQSLLGFECDIAVAGGVSIAVPLRAGYRYEPEGILSADGHCRPFDAKANGTVPGSGVGVVVLKRLEDALRDGDSVHAVLKGSAVNNDGSRKVGFTAPSVLGQAAVISEAIRISGLEPGDISFIEAHGTGTALGDPIEMQALREVFNGLPPNSCAVGSIKSNLGHLDAAAGVTGLIKTVLALKTRQLPGTVHFETPNPALELAESAFYVNSSVVTWDASSRLRAGVSSFGIGGTNAHAVIEQAPPLQPSGPGRPAQLLVLSAKSRSALERQVSELASFLDSNTEEPLADVAFTLHTGRAQLPHRAALACSDAKEARTGLRAASSNLRIRHLRGAAPPIVFLFPGQGSQYVGAAQGIYESEPVFRKTLDRCADLFQRHMETDIREILYPPDGSARSEGPSINQTLLSQPCLFAIGYSLAALCMNWEIRPFAMMGHSIGEIVAACVSGVMSLETATDLVAARGRAMQRTVPGAMLAVLLSADDLAEHLRPDTCLAAINSSSMSTVSGPLEDIHLLEKHLKSLGVTCSILRTSHAFHSASMDPILEGFERHVATLALSPPRIPYLSNLTGTWITAEQAVSPQYYASHLRRPVCFATGLAELLTEPRSLYLELGPGRTLSGFGESHTARTTQAFIPFVQGRDRPLSDELFLADALGQCWVNGCSIDWRRYYDQQRRRRLVLPTYPFERQAYWHSSASQIDNSTAEVTKDRCAACLGKAWKSAAPLRQSIEVDNATWLIFAGSGKIGEHLAERVRACGSNVAIVKPGATFSRTDGNLFTLNPNYRPDFDRLLGDSELQHAVTKIAFAWSLGDDSTPDGATAPFLGLLNLVQSVSAVSAERHIRLTVITHDTQAVMNEEPASPASALLAGLSTVIRQEIGGVDIRVIDVSARYLDPDLLATEVLGDTRDLNVFLRGSRRWVPILENVVPDPNAQVPVLQQGSACVLLGPPSRTLFELRDVLVATWQARVVTLEDSLERHEEFAAALSEATRQLNGIDALFYVPGTQPSGLIQAANPSQVDAVVGRLLRELNTLEQAVLKERVPPLVLFSSTAGTTGGIGQMLTTVAGTLMDAYADYWRLRWRQSAIAFAWDPFAWETWPGADISAEPDIQAQIKATLEAYGLRRTDMAAALDSGLRGSAAQIVVSRRNFAEVLEQYRSQRLADLIATMGSGDRAVVRHPRPNLETPYVAPQSPQEQLIASIWQDLFGLEAVGIHDRFFDLGGSSLLAIQLIARLRQALQRDLSMEVVFTHPTVFKLSEYLTPPPDLSADQLAEVERIAAELALLSDEERSALFTAGEAFAGGSGM